MLKDGSRDVGERCPSELRLLEPLQTCDVPTIKSPGLVSVQKDGVYYGPEDHDLAFYSEAMIAENPMLELSIRSMSCFDPVANVSFAGTIIRDYATNVEKFIDNFYRMSVGIDADV